MSLLQQPVPLPNPNPAHPSKTTNPIGLQLSVNYNSVKLITYKKVSLCMNHILFLQLNFLIPVVIPQSNIFGVCFCYILKVIKFINFSKILKILELHTYVKFKKQMSITKCCQHLL